MFCAWRVAAAVRSALTLRPGKASGRAGLVGRRDEGGSWVATGCCLACDEHDAGCHRSEDRQGAVRDAASWRSATTPNFGAASGSRGSQEHEPVTSEAGRPRTLRTRALGT